MGWGASLGASSISYPPHPRSPLLQRLSNESLPRLWRDPSINLTPQGSDECVFSGLVIESVHQEEFANPASEAFAPSDSSVYSLDAVSSFSSEWAFDSEIWANYY